MTELTTKNFVFQPTDSYRTIGEPKPFFEIFVKQPIKNFTKKKKKKNGDSRQ